MRNNDCKCTEIHWCENKKLYNTNNGKKKKKKLDKVNLITVTIVLTIRIAGNNNILVCVGGTFKVPKKLLKHIWSWTSVDRRE